MDAMNDENLRLRKRLAVVITEADEVIRTTREVTAKKKKEPGLYFDGLETVAAFENRIAVLENEKAQLALEKFGIMYWGFG
ncbi:hypothetical protein E2P81_ATG07230 [Venturia nashicola]|uniref:Uncharacterized protein n=1 Tax=Venturia nashicola TaxID=86259 RepID=A0A4Z1NVE2_9PEZI|nr:hypothetical protein E6O75_ATG07391 [Venturia nashicola]TLD31740.1 hypothetical protein E2P81_ATG07230 [Venturia nashicola]